MCRPFRLIRVSDTPRLQILVWYSRFGVKHCQFPFWSQEKVEIHWKMKVSAAYKSAREEARFHTKVEDRVPQNLKICNDRYTSKIVFCRFALVLVTKNDRNLRYQVQIKEISWDIVKILHCPTVLKPKNDLQLRF